MRKNTEKGITLIALVVTIVVLLILAGISIAMLTGENGVISQARNAKEATDQAKVEELVSGQMCMQKMKQHFQHI